MSTRTLLRATLAAALVAACADLTGPAVEFEAAWQRWQRSGVTEYRYDVQILCFCGQVTTSPVTVTVSGGQTVSLVYADSLTPADTAMFRDVRTMDALFARLLSILRQKPDRFVATYHPTIGYPITVSVDPEAQLADEEVSYRVTNFSTPSR